MNTIKKRLLITFAAFATIPMVLTACTSSGGGQGNGGADDSLGTSEVIVLAAQGEVPPLDPHRMTGTVGLRVVDAIYDTLVRENLKNSSKGPAQIEPALAENWTVSEDGLTYNFEIREDVLFHDGSELNADAVKLNFDRIADEGSSVFSETAAANMKFITRWIDKYEVTENGELAVTLSQTFPEFVNLLGDRRMGIISPLLLDESDDDQIASTPIGTGPYHAGTIEQGKDIVLDRNSDYWRGEPLTPQLLFTTISDANTMVSALQTGQIDVILNAGSGQIAQIQGDDAYTIQYPEPANSYFIRLNTEANVGTDDVLVRQALNYAVDRDSIATIMNDQATPLTGAIPGGNSAWDESVNSKYDYDPAKAKALLEEAGVSTPLEISLLAPSEGPGFSQSRAVMSLVQEDFAEVGVELDIQFMEFTAQIALEGPGYTEDINGSFNGWTTGADLAFWLENMFSPDLQPPAGTNRGWYENEDLGNKFSEGRAELDDNARAEIYREAGEIIDEDAPWVFLYQDRLPRAFVAEISGPVETPSVFFDYATLNKTK